MTPDGRFVGLPRSPFEGTAGRHPTAGIESAEAYAWPAFNLSGPSIPPSLATIISGSGVFSHPHRPTSATPPPPPTNNTNTLTSSGGRTVTTFRAAPASPRPGGSTPRSVPPSPRAATHPTLAPQPFGSGLPFSGSISGLLGPQGEPVAQALMSIDSAGRDASNRKGLGSGEVVPPSDTGEVVAPSDTGEKVGEGVHGGEGSRAYELRQRHRQERATVQEGQEEEEEYKEDKEERTEDDEEGTPTPLPGSPRSPGAGGRGGGGDGLSGVTNEEERRRLKRRIANRESARRVRARRQELIEELQSKCAMLTQQSARLLAHNNTVTQHRRMLAGQVTLMRDRLNQKANEAAALAAESAALRKALQDRGVNPAEVVANLLNQVRGVQGGQMLGSALESNLNLSMGNGQQAANQLNQISQGQLQMPSQEQHQQHQQHQHQQHQQQPLSMYTSAFAPVQPGDGFGSLGLSFGGANPVKQQHQHQQPAATAAASAAMAAAAAANALMPPVTGGGFTSQLNGFDF